MAKNEPVKILRSIAGDPTNHPVIGIVVSNVCSKSGCPIYYPFRLPGYMHTVLCSVKLQSFCSISPQPSTQSGMALSM